jgi:adenosylhomocysteinase
VGVIGYGPVGRGLAAYARAGGAAVEVVERDPILQLVAHYDGYPTPTLEDALKRVGLVVTATGGRGVIGPEELRPARQGLVLINAGHGDHEIDVVGIKGASAAYDQIADKVVAYQLEDGPRVIVLADGHPLNIVMNAGSPEPLLVHFAALGLALERLTQGGLPPGVMVVPAELEADAARLALKALGRAHG